MRPALIITHLPDRQSGLAGRVLKDAGFIIREVNMIDCGELPKAEECAAVIALGGKVSSTQLHLHPFLTAELVLLRSALHRTVPTLGICLGAQLLALAAGGHVSRMRRVYVGWPHLHLTHVGRRDVVFGGLPSCIRALKWHEDGIDPPPSAAVLLTSDSPGAAVFRVGAAAWGSQMHIEATPAMVASWLEDPDEILKVKSAGHALADFRGECTRRLPAQRAAMIPILTRFATFARAYPHAVAGP